LARIASQMKASLAVMAPYSGSAPRRGNLVRLEWLAEEAGVEPAGDA
jgi:hypothetical protein